MKIAAIDTREKFEAAKALGLLSEKEVIQVEARLVKLASKPTCQKVTPVETVTGGGKSWKGEEYKTGIFTRTNDGKNGEFTSTFFRPGYKQMCYVATEDLKILTEAMISHIEALEAQGFKFKG
jgi:hypothetical protein